MWNFKLGDTKLDTFLAKNKADFYIFWNAMMESLEKSENLEFQTFFGKSLPNFEFPNLKLNNPFC